MTNTTRVLSTRVSQDCYFQILDYAKLENLSMSDYLIASVNSYERYKREIDKSLSNILIRRGFDITGMTIEEKNIELNVLINRIEEENNKLQQEIRKLELTNRMKIEIDKINIALAEPVQEGAIKPTRIRSIKKCKS